MKKITMITIIIFLILIANLSVYADVGHSDKYTKEYIQLETGEKLYFGMEIFDKEAKENGWVYLYDLHEEEVLYIELPNGIKFYTQNGVRIYWPTDNQGRPWDLRPLKDPKNQYDGFKIVFNQKPLSGWSYEKPISQMGMGKKYPLNFPNEPFIDLAFRGTKNINFKEWTVDIYSKVVDKVIEPKKQFWKLMNVDGNWRYYYGMAGEYVDNPYSGADKLSNPLKGYEIYGKNYIRRPWEDKSYPKVAMGYYNKVYEDRGKKIEEKYIHAYYMYSYFYDDFDAEMKLLAKQNGLDPNNIEDKVRTMFDYCSISSLSADGQYGLMQLKQEGKDSDYTVSLPMARLVSVKNLRIASPDYPILTEDGSIRLDKINIYDYETGEKILADKPLASRQRIKAEWFLGYASVDETTKTINHPIKTNLAVLFNDNTDLSHTDMYFSGIIGDELSSLSSVQNAAISMDNTMYLDYPENLVTYNQIIELPEYTKDGKPINKVTIVALLPYQENFYRNDDRSKSDNEINMDDKSQVEYKVEAKELHDLTLPEFYLTDNTGKKVENNEVMYGKEYIPYIKITNTGESLTQNIIQAGITNSIKGQTYSALRNESVGERVNMENPRQIARGEIATYKGNSFIVDKYDSLLRLTAFIPSTYDGTDNIFIEEDDIKQLTFNINKQQEVDNSIVNIQLFDTNGKEYSTKNLDGITYSMEPQRQYYSIITVRRNSGATILNQPSLKVMYKITQGDEVTMKTLTTLKALRSIGDTIQYRLDGLVSDSGYIDILASFEYPDLDMSNNQMSKCWIGQYNIAVMKFALKPERSSRGTNPYVSTPISFSSTLVYQAQGENSSGILQDVPVEIKFKGQRVFYDEVTLQSGKAYQLNGSFNNGQKYNLTDGNHVAYIGVNGGKNGAFSSRKYTEKSKNGDPYGDNEKSSFVNVFGQQQNIELASCNQPRYKNSWGVTFYMFKATGDLKSGRVTRCNKSGCREVTITWCENSEYEDWEERRNYTETFSTTVMFRSLDTINKYGGQGWIDLSLNSSSGTVKAGQWYEFYVKTNYSTNRNSMPAEWKRNKCNYQVRNPGVSPVYNVPSYISIKIYNYGQTEKYNLYSYAEEGSWNNYTKYYRIEATDIFGETKTRKYIASDGKNGVIKLGISTEPFDGHNSDYEHPNQQLCASKVFNIYVKGPMPNESSIIGH